MMPKTLSTARKTADQNQKPHQKPSASWRLALQQRLRNAVDTLNRDRWHLYSPASHIKREGLPSLLNLPARYGGPGTSLRRST